MSENTLTKSCCKCGSTDISTTYKKAGDRLDFDVNSMALWNYAETELLRRCCRTCGYRWNEDCLDTDISLPKGAIVNLTMGIEGKK